MGAGISFLGGWENGIVSLGLGFTNEKKTIEKWEWDLDLNKTVEMGMGFRFNKTMGIGFAQNPDWKMG